MSRWIVFAMAGAAIIASAGPASAQAKATAADSAVAAAARAALLAPVLLHANQQQPHAIEHSDAYYTRLTIHRFGSYAMLPLFAGEYWLGNKLINGGDVGSWVKPTHVGVASALGGLFAINTVTGLWNLAESRKDPGGARRWLHAALMLASDAGFAYTATLGDDAGENEVENGFENEGGGANRHRNFAIGSMGLSAAGAVLMWLWKD